MPDHFYQSRAARVLAHIVQIGGHQILIDRCQRHQITGPNIGLNDLGHSPDQQHPDFSTFHIGEPVPFQFDPRLLKSS